MESVLFLYTITVMLLCAAAAALSLAACTVSRNALYAALAVLFLAYFFDLSLIFQGEYLHHGTLANLSDYYAISDPVIKTVLFGCVLGAILYITIAFVDGKPAANQWTRIVVPVLGYFLACFLVYSLVADAPLRQWLFFTMREIFVLLCAAYALWRYRRAATPVEKARLAKKRGLFALTVALALCTVAENTVMIFLWHPIPESLSAQLALYLANRNFSENALIIVYAILAMRAAMRVLQLRAHEAPAPAMDVVSQHMIELLPAFCERHHLTARECELLPELLGEKDYQNIASAMHLAVGTVKSHTHNILRKTDQPSREALRQFFWRE